MKKSLQIIRKVVFIGLLALTGQGAYSQIFNGTGGAVADAPLTTDFTLNVTGVGTMDPGFLRYVTLNVTHAVTEELTISLISPSNTVLTLSIKNGVSADFTETVLTYNPSAGSIINGKNPFTGKFRPEGVITDANPRGFEVFNGEDADGAWTLSFQDGVPGNAGVLLNWKMEFSPNVLPPAPITNFTADLTVAPPNDTILFTDNSTQTPTEWEWNFGADADPQFMTGKGPHKVIYTALGKKTVSLKSINAGGSTTETKTDYINITNQKVPVANFSANKLTAVTNENILFADNSTNTPTTWAWNFGEGASPATATTKGPHTVKYSTTGTKTVTLTSSNGAGTDTETKTDYITINTPVIAPEANFEASTVEVFTGDTVIFTDMSTNNPDSWTWEFGTDATPQNALSKGPHKVVFSTEGKKTISLNVVNSAGDSLLTKTDYITVNKKATGNTPEANFTFTTNELLATFSNTSTNTPETYAWDFGDTEKSTLENPTHTYAAKGTYDVRLIATNSFGADTINKSVTVDKQVGINRNASTITKLFTLYPNPNKGNLFIKSDNSISEYTVQVRNVLGSIVISKVVETKSNSDSNIDLTSMPDGIYLVSIHSNSGSITQRITLRK